MCPLYADVAMDAIERICNALTDRVYEDAGWLCEFTENSMPNLCFIYFILKREVAMKDLTP